MRDFAGKVAVITGAGRGIGRGIALRCAQEGMKIVLAGIGQLTDQCPGIFMIRVQCQDLSKTAQRFFIFIRS